MRRLIVSTIVAGLLAVIVLLGTAPSLSQWPDHVPLPDDLDSYLARTEAKVAAITPLVDDTEKRIVWRQKGVRSDYAVVMLHGFSASRQETAPLGERVADALDANLFETRLRGHGLQDCALHDVSAEDWLSDAMEALSIGQNIGKRVVLIGTSTGGTLAAALAQREDAAGLDTVVMISPNFMPANPTAAWVTKPGGKWLLRGVEGSSREWKPHNDLQGRYWTTRYPTDALVEVMRLVDFVNASIPMTLETSLLVLQSPDDTVVSAAATFAAFESATAPRKRLIRFSRAGDPSQHVLAGDVLSAAQTEAVASAIVDFVTGVSPASSGAP